MVEVHSEIEGLEEILKKMERLGNLKKNRKLLLKVMRKAMKPVRVDAAENAKRLDDPKTAEKIHTEVAINAGRHRNGVFVMRVGVRGGALNRYANNRKNIRTRKAGKAYKTDGRVFYWRFHEFGTRKMGKREFLRPALYNNRQQVAKIMGEQLRKEFEKLVEKGEF